MTPLFCIILFVIFTYLIIGVFDIKQNIFVKSINSVGEGNICLTFDDGPDPIMTPKILEILNKHGIKGTFFLIGKNVLANQELVKQISDEGHSIGSHTYYHKTIFPISSENKITEEIIKTNQLLEQITSKKIIFFRPPFGITNPNIKKTLKKLEMTSVGWDVRSLDTITKDAKKLSNRVINGINKGGSIILFHDRCKSTLAILEKIIIYCHEKGLKFKTINNA